MRYLLITFIRKANGQIDELVSTSKKIKNTDLQSCNVILDYGDKKIIKCVIEGKKTDTDWDRMNGYYLKVYPKLIEQLERQGQIEVKVK